MPGWAQAVLGVAALVTALSVIWSKVLRPGIRAASVAEEMLPLLRELTVAFRGSPQAFQVLYDMARQFKTDSGSSLRDVVNRLEEAAIENARLSRELKVQVEARDLLSGRDREQISRLIRGLDRVTDQVTALTASGVRIESDRAQVAKELRERIDVVDKATAGVAKDLADSHDRADLASDHPGMAADAASRSEPEEEEK